MIRGSGPAAPPRRVRRLDWRRAPYLALDFETTGLDLVHDRIVSFGAVPIERAAVRLAGAEHHVVDAGGRAPSRSSVRIHRLRPVDVLAGMSQAESAHMLERLLAGRFLVAWFAEVEIAFLCGLFGTRTRSWDLRTIDVRDMYLAEMGPEAERASLSRVASELGVPVVDPHQALDDALVTAQAFLVLAARRERREGRPPPVTSFVRTAFDRGSRT